MIKIYNIDWEDLELPEKSIDMILSDLPYGITSNKWDTPINIPLMWERFDYWLKPNAPVLLFSVDPFTSTIVQSNIKCYKFKWYWKKNMAGNFAVARFMPMSHIEEICVFGARKERINYYPILEKANYKRSPSKTPKNGRGFGGLRGKGKEYNYKQPKNVLEFNCVDRLNSLHPSQKPVKLLEYLIKSHSLEGETILDITMGSGSTGEACKNTSRNFIGCEIEKDIYNIAVDRIKG